MKKLLVLAIIVSGLNAMAGYGAAGCGLGAVLFEGKNDKVSQILAATTNTVVSGNQTFGITTGTLNCDTGRLRISITTFIEANKFALANDVARGEGEALSALSNLYGCQNVSTISSKMKKDYAKIFDSANPTAEALSLKFSGYMRACI